MGNGPALHSSTSEKYSGFLTEFSRTSSLTHRAVSSFLSEYKNAIYGSDATIAVEYATVEAVTTGLGLITGGAPAFDWGTSREEFARLFMAADALARLTNVSKVFPGLTHLQIEIGIPSPPAPIPSMPWPIPTPPSVADPAEADLDGKYDEEVQVQGSAPELFMLYAAEQFPAGSSPLPYNKTYLGLAVDLASLLIPTVVFRAKAICGLKRPYEVTPSHPVATARPEHSSWPGGHAFWGGALAVLIYHALFDKVQVADRLNLWKRLRKAALRIARNRVRAGLHWEIDTLDGFAQGKFAMEQWILLSKAVHLTQGHPGDAGDLWRILSKV